MLEDKRKALVVIRNYKKNSKDNQINNIGARLIKHLRRNLIVAVKNLRRIRCQDFSPDNIIKNFKNLVNKMK